MLEESRLQWPALTLTCYSVLISVARPGGRIRGAGLPSTPTALKWPTTHPWEERTMSDTRTLTRRTLLAGTSAAAALGLTGWPALAQVNWKKFAGTKIEVNLVKSPRGDTLQKYEKEFTDLTGIQVSSEQTPEQQQRQKAVIELSSGRPSFDVDPHELPRAEAAVREGRLARRPLGLRQGRVAHRPEPQRGRLLAGRPALRQERAGPAPVAALLGRLLDRLLEQGPFRQEGPRLPGDLRRDGRRPPRR